MPKGIYDDDAAERQRDARRSVGPSPVKVKVSAHVHEFDSANPDSECLVEGCRVTANMASAVRPKPAASQPAKPARQCPSCGFSVTDGRVAQCPRCLTNLPRKNRPPTEEVKQFGRIGSSQAAPKKCPACGETGIDYRKRYCPKCNTVMPAWREYLEKFKKKQSDPPVAAAADKTPDPEPTPSDNPEPAAATSEPETTRPSAIAGLAAATRKPNPPESTDMRGEPTPPDSITDVEHPDELREKLIAYAGKVISDGIKQGFSLDIADDVMAGLVVEFDAANRQVRLYRSEVDDAS